MIIIVAFIASVAFLLIALAIYNIVKQKNMIDSFSTDFFEVLNDAEQLKQDLNIMMENAIDVSRSLVNELDAKVSLVETLETIPEELSDSTITSPKQGRLRVYELARELNINSKELLGILRAHDYNYRSHMNVIDDDIAQEVRAMYQKNDLTYSQIAVHEEIDINETIDTYGNNFSLEEIKKAHPYLAVSILNDQGYSIKEIAKILERGQGEISLILNLSKKTKVI